MKTNKIILAAGLSGIIISLVGLVADYTSFAEFLSFFKLFGAGIVYGLATAF